MAETTIKDFENSLRILARIIAQAYLKDLSSNQPAISSSSKIDKEEGNGERQSGLRGVENSSQNDCPGISR